MAAWRGRDWHGGTVEVEIGEVGLGGFCWGFFFFFFWWLLWPVSRFVEIGVERVFFCGCCGPCLSLVV